MTSLMSTPAASSATSTVDFFTSDGRVRMRSLSSICEILRIEYPCGAGGISAALYISSKEVGSETGVVNFGSAAMPEEISATVCAALLAPGAFGVFGGPG